MVEADLEQKLIEIEKGLEQINEPPHTTLEIIGRADEEIDWESFLVYFLDNDNPHGFDTDVLEAFLEAVISHPETKLSKPLSNLEQVEVYSQVSTGTGPVDILLWLKNQWYICIELKVGSPETGEQTVRYADANNLGGLVVSQHDGVGDYVYLNPTNKRPPTSDEFVEISWEHTVEHLEEVLVEGYGQYPSKSTAQLADYLDTIRKELNMGDFDSISEETELYMKYADAIERITDHYNSDKNKIFKALRDAFFSEEQISRGEWRDSNRADRYIKFYKPHWHGVDDGVNIEYEPHVNLIQDSPEIRLRLDIESGQKEVIRDNLMNRLGQTDWNELEEKGWETTGGSYSFIAKSVPLDLDNPMESIQQAIQELHGFREIVEPHIEEIAAEN